MSSDSALPRAVLWVLVGTVVCTLVGTAACGDSARGARMPVMPLAPEDVPFGDASLGPIEGCPAMFGPRGRWDTIEPPPAFTARISPNIVIADNALIIYGGEGVRVDSEDSWVFVPRENRWTQLPDGGPRGNSRYLATAWITDTRELFVWRGIAHAGARLTQAGQWRALPAANAPVTTQGRALNVGAKIFLWAGASEGDHNEVRLYDPRTDRWEVVLAPREQNSTAGSSLVSTGREVIVWGGGEATGLNGPYRNVGWRFNEATGQWSTVSVDNAPAARGQHAGFWTGSAMLIWGGMNNRNQLQSGGLYYPNPDGWRPMLSSGAPGSETVGRHYDEFAVWTGSDLYVWTFQQENQTTAGRYDPRVDRWFSADPPPDANQRVEAAAVWFDCALYVIGGRTPVMGGDRTFTRELDRWRP